MANKEKLLAAVQKNLQKGQVKKAIKDLAKVVKADPADMRNRQKLADLYSRSGMKADALEEYWAVADHYAEHGFHLKAIALYKQMQKLDPSRDEIYFKLAELNEKQGLIGNALVEYGALVERYQKAKEFQDAYKVLERMKDLDPENLNIRTRVIESCLQNGLEEQGESELNEVLALLKEKGGAARFLKVYEMLLPRFPKDLCLRRGYAQALVAKGDTERGLELLQQLGEEAPEDDTVRRSLADVYRQLGRSDEAEVLYRRLLEENPADAEVHVDLAETLLKNDKEGLAREHLRANREELIAAGFQDRLEDLEQRLSATAAQEAQATGEADVPLPPPEPAAQPSSPAAQPVPTPAETSRPPSRKPPGELHVPLEEAGLDLELEVDLDEESWGEAPSNPVGVSEGEPGEAGAAADEGQMESVEETGPGEEEEILDLEPEDFPDEELPGQFEEQAPGGTELPESPQDGAPFEEEDVLELELELGDALEVEEDPDAEFDETAQLEEADFYLRQGLVAEAGEIFRTVLEVNPQCRIAQEKLETIAAAAEAKGEASDEAQEPGAEDGFDDLLEGIEDEVGDALLPEQEPPAGSDRLAGDLSEFRKGIESQIGQEDVETHYNLGIAYREMGLIDDAIEEFDIAARSPDRAVDAMTLKGLCLVQKGAFEEAEQAFGKGLEAPQLSESQTLSLNYELGCLYQAWNRSQQALDAFVRVEESDPGFRDVKDRLGILRQKLGLDDSSGGGGSGDGGKNRVSYL